MEEYKDIPGYGGYYQISNLGNFKSLEREVKHYRGSMRILRERELTPQLSKRGYYFFDLYKKNKRKKYKRSQLIAMAFLGHIPDGNKIVVDHIDNNKINDRLDNLQLITNRENSSKDQKGHTSNYIGVSWYKPLSKWRSSIYLDGKPSNLGYFENEIDAYNAYQKKLEEVM